MATLRDRRGVDSGNGLGRGPGHAPVETVNIFWADLLLWTFVIGLVAGMLLAALAGRI